MIKIINYKLTIVILSLIFVILNCLVKHSQSRLTILSKHEQIAYKQKIRTMFYEAYGSYVNNAIDYDELKPISCSGMNTWGTFSLSLIDALDMLAIMDNHTEFRRVAQHILDTADFETNTNVSVFETNIRVVGGLLSAHLFSRRAGFYTDQGWPCSGPLLKLAEKVARKLLPAFDTPTGMPYGTVNFRYGVPENETPITCTAGVGTFIVEFGTLSRLTGDPIFEEKALNALEALQRFRSKIGLLGNHINVLDGKWTATDAGIGAGVDSYFEYLVKGSMLLQMPSLIDVFHYDYGLIKNYLKKNDWFIWVSMVSGSATMPIFQSLEAFFPGLLTLIGDLDQAKKSLYNYHQVWKQYGFVPEFYDIVHGKHHKREGYPLRPEFIESVYYLYRATKDSHLLSIGADVIDSIYYSARTECGYATIKSVSDHTIEDRMESFFLAETLKYLYLLFDEDNFINENGSFGTIIEFRGKEPPLERSCVIESGGYVFNTEAHPIDIAALGCCSRFDDHETYIDDNIDLSDLFFESSLRRPSKSSSSVHDYEKTEDNIKPTDSQSSPTQYSTIQEPRRRTFDPTSDETSLNSETGIESSFTMQDILDSKLETLVEQTSINQTIEDQQPETTSSSYSSVNEPIYTGSIPTLSSVDQTGPPQSAEISMNMSSIVIESDTITMTTATIQQQSTPQTEFSDNFEDDHSESFSSSKFLNIENNGSYESLSCPSQSFLIRLSLYGQMFE